MFYVTVHRFLARFQSLACTTYGKFLLERIMAVLTPKSGILGLILFNLSVNDLFFFIEEASNYNFADDNSFSALA